VAGGAGADDDDFRMHGTGTEGRSFEGSG
jgi:hypothetical protein